MRRFLSCFSLVLTLVICLSVFPVSAEEPEVFESDYVIPEGIQVYYANDISGKNAPIIDGVISDGEYGDMTVNIKDHISTNDGDVILPEKADQPCADSFDYYFAYDDNFIYIAYVDNGGVWEEGSIIDTYIKNTTTESVKNYVSRNNYYLNLGFFLDDITSNFHLGCSSRGWDENRYFEFGKAQATIKDPYVIVSEMYMTRTLKDDPTKVIAKGDGKSVNNKNSLDGPYVATVEFKIDKAQLKQFISDYFFINYEELPNAMYIYFTGRSYVLKSNGEQCDDLTSYNRYFSTPIADLAEDIDLEAYGLFAGKTKQTFPGLIVFGDENTKIHFGYEEGELPSSETPTTELVTEAPTNENPTEAPVTEEEVTEAPVAEGGCGSSVALAGIALVAALGTCTAFVAKKKED